MFVFTIYIYITNNDFGLEEENIMTQALAACTHTCFAFSNCPQAAYVFISSMKICFVALNSDCFSSS